MPLNLAPISPGATVAHFAHAGMRSSIQPPGCCSRTLTRLPCGMAGLPSGPALMAGHSGALFAVSHSAVLGEMGTTMAHSLGRRPPALYQSVCQQSQP
jgi:hypothetical protein